MWFNTILSLFVGSLLIGINCVNAQKPDKIGGIAKSNQGLSYYQEQSNLWNQLIEADSENAEAWHYYYKSERARLQLEKPKIWANNKEAFYQELNPILDKAKSAIGNTFEYYYLQGLNASGSKSIQFLQKAYEIDSSREEIYGWLFSYYVPIFDEENSKDLAQKMLKSNIYSDANLKWNYNALQSAEENGLIISNGDLDGLPKWTLQYGANIREDVLVVSKWLLADDENYKVEVFKKLNISLPPKEKTDFEDVGEYADYLAVEVLTRTNRPAYLSIGNPDSFFAAYGLEGKMFLVGNILKYSEEKIDEIPILEENFNEKYYLEYLLKNFQSHHEDEIVKKQLNLTYLEGMQQLQHHYQEVGQLEKSNHYARLIEKIAEDSGQKEEVMKWLRE